MYGFKAQSIVDIARHAGDNILLPNWGKVEKEIKGDGSPVTVVDKMTSDYVIGALKKLTPNIPVISEEASVEENKDAMKSSLRWVVDPLDGTATYLKGPIYGDTTGFGVHIGLVENGTAIKGFAYFPAQRCMYFTGDDGNAYMQIKGDAPTQIHVQQLLDGSRIRAATPWRAEKRPLSINGHAYESLPAVGGEEICKVACGEADLMWHERPDRTAPLEKRYVFSHWDVAASHAIIKAAGGNLYELATGREVTYDALDFAVVACAAGHTDLLKQINFVPESGVKKTTPGPAPL